MEKNKGQNEKKKFGDTAIRKNKKKTDFREAKMDAFPQNSDENSDELKL